MKIIILQDFTYWHNGCNRVDYVAGDEIDTEDSEMVSVAVGEGWAKADDAQQKSAEQTPAEQTPAEQTPAEQTPAEQTPAEQTPAKKTKSSKE
ncbi:hypothetical protein [Undibacterium baiyunense]|uniref:Uncharacterized protein n=1 Tax=Undibacterium baiyunense TaxID=2828731 RepID=A0A941I4Z3_9BURK|nr:hypothetical protein [Undibacterium baiyunense]MBR7747454.1 hypothetical protein [Undibacterium baiyunense]